GISADEFVIANPQVKFRADGAFASDTADFDIALDLSDLGLIADEASGALSVRGSARSEALEAPLVLLLDGQVASGALGQYALRDAKVGVAASLLEGTLTDDVTGNAMLDGHLATLTTHFAADETQQELTGLGFEIAGTRVSGNVSRMAETGLL